MDSIEIYHIDEGGITVSQKYGDSYRKLSAGIIGLTIPDFYVDLYCAMASEGHGPSTVFLGFINSASKIWKPADRTAQIQGVDRGWYLMRQFGSYEYIKEWTIDLTTYPEVNDETDPIETMRRLLGHDPLGTDYLWWTGIVPYVIGTEGGTLGWGTTIPFKMFTIDENTTIWKTIQEICDHCGYIFHIKIGPVTDGEGNPLPCAYWVPFGSIDNDIDDGGLDLPGMVTIDWSNSLVESINSEIKEDEYANDIYVYTQQTDIITGEWIVGHAETTEVTEGDETRIIMTFRREDIEDQTTADDVAAEILALTSSPPTIYTVVIRDLIDLQLYQKIKFTNFSGVSNEDLRIIDIEYTKSMKGIFVKVQCIPNINFTQKFMYRILIQDRVTATQSIAGDLIKEKIPETLIGTATATPGKFTTEKDGRTVPARTG